MLDLTRPIWRSFPGCRWITVGDGCYGSDAAYLPSHGVSDIATSLTDDRLKYAHEQGYIPAFQAENAERIGTRMLISNPWMLAVISAPVISCLRWVG